MEQVLDPVETLRQHIVRVDASSGQVLGTGIFLSPTLVLTCRHVLEAGGESLEPASTRLVFFGRDNDPRQPVRIFLLAGARTYRSDVALIEFDEPFRAGEQVPAWMSGFPPVGSDVTFVGYRQQSRRHVDPEFVQTKVGLYDQERGCYMLREESTQGFSGGPVACLTSAGWQLAGIVVANLQLRPSRTWCLPAGSVRRAVNAMTGPDGPRLPALRAGPEAAPGLGYLAELIQRHNPLHEFIDLGVEALFPVRETAPSAVAKIVDLVRGSGEAPKRVLFFGHYGSGKTCIAITAARELLENFDSADRSSKIPIYIEFREWKALPSWTELARYIGESGRYPVTSVAEVLKLAAQDRLVFILDGLDELTEATSFQNAVSLVQEIPAMVYDGASFVVFLRFSFLLERRNLLEMLEEPDFVIPDALAQSLSVIRYQAYGVSPPLERDITRYLTAVCGEDAEYALRVVREIYNLADLARRPVLLSMIARCMPALRREQFDPGTPRRVKVGPIDLYNIYTSQWLRNPKHRSSLTYVRRRHLVEGLAVYMWEHETLRIRHTELDGYLKSALGHTGLGDIMYDISNCSFLDLVADGYEFSHKSFLEFFVASAMCQDIFQSDRAGFSDESLLVRCMRHAPSQNEVAAFLRDLVVRRLEAQRGLVQVMSQFFLSPFDEDRAWAGHLLGHAAAELKDDDLLSSIAEAYEREQDPWVKRSLALACGRAGRPEVVQHYAEALLPLPAHRLVNLRYHLEYYGGVRRTVEAVASHLLSSRYEFLWPIDTFTIRQVMANEAPLGPEDAWVAAVLRGLIDQDAASDLQAAIQSIGLPELIEALDAASREVS